MRRIFETDAVIIAALILVVGTYKLATSEDVQDGFVRLVQQLRNNPESTQTNGSADSTASVAESDPVGSSSSSPSSPSSAVRTSVPAVPRQLATRDEAAAAIDVLPPDSDANHASTAQPTPTATHEQPAQAMARGRERLATSRVYVLEFANRSGYTRSCLPSRTVRSSCGRIQ